jgi:hypothetical protein
MGKKGNNMIVPNIDKRSIWTPERQLSHWLKTNDPEERKKRSERAKAYWDKKGRKMTQTDLLTAIATAAEQLQSGAKPKAIAADLERLVMELQKGE